MLCLFKMAVVMVTFRDFPQDVLDVIEEEVLSESEEVRRCGFVEVW